MKISSIKNNSLNSNYKTNKINSAKTISFQRSWAEHQSWGVRLNSKPDGSATAKIFTYPDAKFVQLQINENKPDEKVFELENKGDGIFETTIPKNSIKEGDDYQFVIKKANDVIVKVKDPYSFHQPKLSGASRVYNHRRFNWDDFSWYDEKNTQRISRKANSKNGLLPVESAIIYEMNIATLTQKGNFEEAARKLRGKQK